MFPRCHAWRSSVSERPQDQPAEGRRNPIRFQARGFRVGAFAALAGLALLLAACANPTASSRVYTFEQTQRAQTVLLGHVTAVRPITIQSSGTSGLGMVAGGALGAVAGNAIGGGSGRRITTVGGAVGGAMAGNAVENARGRTQGLEITVQLDNGEMRVIAQQADVAVGVGQRVQIVTQGGASRVAPI